MNKLLLCLVTAFSSIFGEEAFVIYTKKTSKNTTVQLEKPVDHSFGFLEISAFPARYKNNQFGIALGYRASYDETIGADFTFHVMKNPTADLVYCGKINQLYYLLPKSDKISPYVGFGFVLGLGPVLGMIDERQCPYARHTLDHEQDHKEYEIFTNGEMVVGIETQKNGKRQFFELTYYARTTTIQFSIGVGL